MPSPSVRNAIAAVRSFALPASRDEAMALLVPFAVYLVASSLTGSWIIDDAGITFAYAKNLAHGDGFVSQPGRPPVEGFSDFLWMLLMVPFFVLHLFQPVVVPKALGALFVLGSFRAVQRALQDERATGRVLPGFFVALLFAASPPLAIWCASGLENALYLFLVCLLYALSVLRPGRWRLASGVVKGLVAMTRPEGITLAAAGLAIALGEWMARRASRREALTQALEYLRGLAYVMVPFLALRLAVFEHLVPHTYYAKRTFLDASERLDYFSDHPEAVTDKLMDVGRSLAGKAGPWLLAATLLAVFTLARRGKLRANVGAAAAILVVSILTFVWMDEDWMGELRFGTAVIASAWLTAVAAGYALFEDTSERLRIRAHQALTAIYALATAGLVWMAAPRLLHFAALPPTPYADIDRNYALKLNAYASALGVANASVLTPDCGAMLMDSRLRVYDEAGLFEPDVVRTLKHDGTRWLFDHPDFSDWVFEKTKPTFIVTHDFWTYVTAFEKDARFERDYAPIDAYPDRYVDAVYKARLRSGIYVRRDALAAPEDIDRARESYVASPAREPLVWRLRLAFGLDPANARATDDDLRKRAMAARYQDQNPNRAATLFAQLAERKPDDLEAHTELGDALDAAGRADEARPAWKVALTLARARKDTFHTTLAADRLRGAPPPPPTDDEQGHLMQAGIDALYTQHDPAKAVDVFRKVLALNPQHYGASYQLAVALDAAGRKGEARALWPEVLEMASHLKDEKTMQDVAARIASGG